MLSESSPAVKNDNPVQLDFSGDGVPLVSSLDIARHFQKSHFHVLREIKRLIPQLPEIFVKSNFGFISVNTNTGMGTKKNPVCQLTRDAFTLLAMGFTGKSAMLWKLKYIEAFNSLEAIALEKAKEAGRALFRFGKAIQTFSQGGRSGGLQPPGHGPPAPPSASPNGISTLPPATKQRHDKLNSGRIRSLRSRITATAVNIPRLDSKNFSANSRANFA